jgi:hypothetical protein
MPAVRMTLCDWKEVRFVDVLGHIRAADPNCGDIDQQLTGAGNWILHLLESNIVGTVVDRCPQYGTMRRR